MKNIDYLDLNLAAKKKNKDGSISIDRTRMLLIRKINEMISLLNDLNYSNATIQEIRKPAHDLGYDEGYKKGYDEGYTKGRHDEIESERIAASYKDSVEMGQ